MDSHVSMITSERVDADRIDFLAFVALWRFVVFLATFVTRGARPASPTSAGIVFVNVIRYSLPFFVNIIRLLQTVILIIRNEVREFIKHRRKTDLALQKALEENAALRASHAALAESHAALTVVCIALREANIALREANIALTESNKSLTVKAENYTRFVASVEDIVGTNNPIHRAALSAKSGIDTDDALVESIQEAAKDRRSPWAAFVPAIAGPRSDAHYQVLIDRSVRHSLALIEAKREIALLESRVRTLTRSTGLPEAMDNADLVDNVPSQPRTSASGTNCQATPQNPRPTSMGSIDVLSDSGYGESMAMSKSMEVEQAEPEQLDAAPYMGKFFETGLWDESPSFALEGTEDASSAPESVAKEQAAGNSAFPFKASLPSLKRVVKKLVAASPNRTNETAKVSMARRVFGKLSRSPKRNDKAPRAVDMPSRSTISESQYRSLLRNSLSLSLVVG